MQCSYLCLVCPGDAATYDTRLEQQVINMGGNRIRDQWFRRILGEWLSPTVVDDKLLVEKGPPRCIADRASNRSTRRRTGIELRRLQSSELRDEKRSNAQGTSKRLGRLSEDGALLDTNNLGLSFTS